MFFFLSFFYEKMHREMSIDEMMVAAELGRM